MNLLLSSLPRIKLLHLSTRGSVVGHVEYKQKHVDVNIWRGGITWLPNITLKLGIYNVTPQNSLPMSHSRDVIYDTWQ